MKKNTAILFALIIFCFTPLFGQNNNNIFGSRETFKLSPVTDGILGSTGIVMNGTWLILDKIVKIKPAEYEGGLLNKNSINAFDRLFVNSYNKKIDYLATGLCATLVINPVVLTAAPVQEWLTIGTMFAETFLIANGLKELTKLVINRPRPYMYKSGYPLDKIDDGDWCKSFPSGHTTLAFTGAAFASYVFWKYFPESPWRFVVTAGSFTAATATGVCRIISGNHFITDVLAGAAIGTACGFAIPWIHTFNTEKKSDSVSINASPLGFSFTFFI